MDALDTGIGSQRFTSGIHDRHRCNTQIDLRCSCGGHHPGTTDGSICLTFQEQGVDGIVLRFTGHQCHKLGMIIQRILNSLCIRERNTGIINDGATKAVNPCRRIICGAVLFYETVTSTTSIVLHVGQQFIGGGRNFLILHIATVVHKEQRLKGQRKLIQGVFVGSSSQRHGKVVIQCTFSQQRLDWSQNTHFCKDTDFIMGEDKHVGRGTGIVADQFQRVCQTGFLLKDDLQIRNCGSEISLKCCNHSIFFIMPDDQFVCFSRI